MTQFQSQTADRELDADLQYLLVKIGGGRTFPKGRAKSHDAARRDIGGGAVQKCLPWFKLSTAFSASLRHLWIELPVPCFNLP
jgi:hypothetical protein